MGTELREGWKNERARGRRNSSLELLSIKIYVLYILITFPSVQLLPTTDRCPPSGGGNKSRATRGARNRFGRRSFVSESKHENNDFELRSSYALHHQLSVFYCVWR